MGKTVPASTGPSKDSLFLTRLGVFFARKDRYMAMHDILCRRSKISLRMCDFVCTKMARQGLRVPGPDGNDVYVAAAYRDAQDSHGKLYFDAFRRSKTTPVRFDRFGKKLTTNVAQLRFFEFLITTGVLEYVKQNITKVESLMKQAPGVNVDSRKRRVSAHAVTESVLFRKKPRVLFQGDDTQSDQYGNSGAINSLSQSVNSAFA